MWLLQPQRQDRTHNVYSFKTSLQEIKYEITNS